MANLSNRYTYMKRTLMAYSGRTRIDDIGELANTPTSGSLTVPIAARCCNIRPASAQTISERDPQLRIQESRLTHQYWITRARGRKLFNGFGGVFIFCKLLEELQFDTESDTSMVCQLHLVSELSI